MNLVLQSPYGEACQQACCAMLTGVPLEAVIKELGPQRLSSFRRRDFLNAHGIGAENWGYWVDPVGGACIAALERKHPTLWLTLGSCRDPAYGHAVLLHRGDLYDPWDGMNPSWPWHRYIVMASPLELPE